MRTPCIAGVTGSDNNQGDTAAGLLWEWEHNILPK